jgi:release factor glutamine methyltransferase
MIYEPAEDSHLLEKEIVKYSKGKKVLDMGCGSGIQGDSALRNGASTVLFVDIDEDVVVDLGEKGYDVVKSDLFSNVKEKYDLIVFNPPYLPKDDREDSESERVTSGGMKGDEIIVRFLEDAFEHLNEEGVVLLLVSSLTPRDNIEKVLKVEGVGKKVIAREKISMEELEVWEIKRL